MQLDLDSSNLQADSGWSAQFHQRCLLLRGSAGAQLGGLRGGAVAASRGSDSDRLLLLPLLLLLRSPTAGKYY